MADNRKSNFLKIIAKKFGGSNKRFYICTIKQTKPIKMEQIQNEGGKTLDKLVNSIVKLVNKLKSIIIKSN